MQKFRMDHGQWVKFTGEVPEAHHSADGKIIGIFQRAGADIFGQWQPERVVPVAKDTGENILRQIGGVLRPLAFSVEAPIDLEPVVSRDDIPPLRLATMRPDWVPTP